MKVRVKDLHKLVENIDGEFDRVGDFYYNFKLKEGPHINATMFKLSNKTINIKKTSSCDYYPYRCNKWGWHKDWLEFPKLFKILNGDNDE